MAQANPLKLYPHADLKGDDIRFDILFSSGLIIKTFSDAAANDIAIPDDGEILVVYGDATADCFIELADSITVPADGVFRAALYFIPAGCMKVIDRNGATSFSIIRAADANGFVIIEVAYAYRDTKKQQQHTRS